jgi:hypothetical protein
MFQPVDKTRNQLVPWHGILLDSCSAINIQLATDEALAGEGRSTTRQV